MFLPHYRIDLREVPQSHLARLQDCVAVTPESRLNLRREVERFATYFRREFSYDFQQFSANERIEKGKKPYAAYLFTNEVNHFPRVWAGACCFRWREFKEIEPRWGMQWMWLHPYYRGKGILSRAWDNFHHLHGNFFCEPPFSSAMEAFLRKRGKCIICWQVLGSSQKVICPQCEARHNK